MAAFSCTRRGFVAGGATAFAFAQASESIEVDTSYGRIRGSREKDVCIFRGVPYAGAVSGANRFKAAPVLAPWKGVRDAVTLGPPSWQPGKTYYGLNEPSPDENCLVLNVWTPACDGRKRPVMVYNHGGGFTTGSAGGVKQDGANLARTFDVVVVATNHRLGLLGYLYLGELGGEEYATSGNQGLLDIRDGLKWIHENIARFGGDPANVMIFGESGGGFKTSCLYAMPSAAPYFNKASIESGPGIRMMPRDAAAETTLAVLQQLGLEKTEWRKLLEIPVEKFMAVRRGFSPVVDGTILPAHPFDPAAPAISKNKPLIVGTNRDEATFFFWQSKDTEAFNLTIEGLKARLAKTFEGGKAEKVFEAYRKSRPEASPSDLYIAIMTARVMGAGTAKILNRRYALGGANVYSYVFTHESDWVIPGTQHKYRAGHALEIPYKFNNAGPGGFQAIVDEKSLKTAHNMSQMWSTFARTGVPGAKGQPQWPAWTAKDRATMMLDAECKVVNDPWPLERIVWEQIS